MLGPLPKRRTDDFEETLVRVTRTGGFTLRRVFYTVPSRLVGHRLRVRLYDDRLVLYAGTEHLMTLPRGHAGPGGRRSRVVDYRHVLPSLRFKPVALLNWVCRDDLFPRDAYRRAFDVLLDAGKLPDAALLRERFSQRPGSAPDVDVELPPMPEYDDACLAGGLS